MPPDLRQPNVVHDGRYPREIIRRSAYPYRLTVGQTLGSLLAVLTLILIARFQRKGEAGPTPAVRFHPYRNGLGLMVAFFILGQLLPGLVGSAVKIPIERLRFPCSSGLDSSRIWCAR